MMASAASPACSGMRRCHLADEELGVINQSQLRSAGGFGF